MRKKRSLEEILLERGVLTVEKLQEALEKHREEGGRLGQILQEMGLVSEDELLQALSLQLGIPSLSLSDPSLNLHRATDAFPLKFMQQYKFFPLKLDNGVLTVVMSDPTDVETLDCIRLRLGGVNK